MAAEKNIPLLAKTVFDKADLCVDLREIPVKRSEYLVAEGKLDGELMRTLVWAARFEGEVVPVPTPIHVDQILTISLERRDLIFPSFAALKGHQVLISGGHRWAEASLKELGIEPVQAGSVRRFMELIHFEKVDVALLERSLLPLIKDTNNLRIAPLVPLAYHIVIHRRHKAAVPKVDAALRAYLTTGLTQ